MGGWGGEPRGRGLAPIFLTLPSGEIPSLRFKAPTVRETRDERRPAFFLAQILYVCSFSSLFFFLFRLSTLSASDLFLLKKALK